MLWFVLAGPGLPCYPRVIITVPLSRSLTGSMEITRCLANSLIRNIPQADIQSPSERGPDSPLCLSLSDLYLTVFWALGCPTGHGERGIYSPRCPAHAPASCCRL